MFEEDICHNSLTILVNAVKEIESFDGVNIH